MVQRIALPSLNLLQQVLLLGCESTGLAQDERVRTVDHLQGVVVAHIKLSFGYDRDLAILAPDFHRVGVFETIFETFLVLDQISNLFKDSLGSFNLASGCKGPREVSAFVNKLLLSLGMLDLWWKGASLLVVGLGSLWWHAEIGFELYLTYLGLDHWDALSCGCVGHVSKRWKPHASDGLLKNALELQSLALVRRLFAPLHDRGLSFFLCWDSLHILSRLVTVDQRLKVSLHVSRRGDNCVLLALSPLA